MSADCLPHIHVAAIHAEPGFRSSTPGLGALCTFDEFMAGAGAFKNSLGDTSAYAAVGAQPWRLGPVKVGAIIGGVTGYPQSPTVMAAGFVSVGPVHLTLIPKLPGKTPLTLGLSFTIPIR